MANFYHSTTIFGVEPADVADFANRNQHVGAVSPWDRDQCVLFTADLSARIAFEFARKLSGDLGAITFSVANHGDRSLEFRLVSAGKQADQYNSAPNSFEDANSRPTGGNAALLIEIIGAECEGADVEEVLRCDRDSPGLSPLATFAVVRHKRLMDLLGLTPFGLGGYEDLRSGSHCELSWTQCIPTGSAIT